jgi:N-acetylmuramoyl-L-alanine amidase
VEPDAATQPSRSERGRERRAVRARVARRAGVLVGAIVAIAAGFAAWHLVTAPRSATRPPLADAASVAPPAPATSGKVEIPDLIGMPLVQARAVALAAGLVVQLRTDATLPDDADQSVHAESPAPRTVVKQGATVELTVPGAAVQAAASKHAQKRFVVVIDPGHQAHGDSMPEPIGPGSTETQPKVTAGSTGVVTGIPEYEIDLQIATNLADRLRAAGLTVIMTRTTNDVDLSNSQRAQVANAAKADLFVRVHADSSAETSVTGVATCYPASNQWTAAFAPASRQAARSIEQDLVAATGATDGGAVERDDVAGFNWAKVPSVLVEAGHQSNPIEDRLLASAHYQDELAGGIAEGVVSYLEGGR